MAGLQTCVGPTSPMEHEVGALTVCLLLDGSNGWTHPNQTPRRQSQQMRKTGAEMTHHPCIRNCHQTHLLDFWLGHKTLKTQLRSLSPEQVAESKDEAWSSDLHEQHAHLMLRIRSRALLIYMKELVTAILPHS